MWKALQTHRRFMSERVESGARRAWNLILMVGGLGVAFTILLAVFAFLSQIDAYIGRAPTSQEKLIVIAVLGIILLFVALIGAILFLAGYVVSTIERQGELARRTDLTRGHLRRAIMESGGPAYLAGFELQGMDLSWTRWLRKGNLSGAQLAYANLEAADLEGADLSSADLSHANLTDTDLRGANLSGANFAHAKLSGANLLGANLEGARFGAADIEGAHFDDEGLRIAAPDRLAANSDAGSESEE